MTVYDDIRFSGPALAEIDAICLAYPNAARLRNANGQDIGSTNGNLDANIWVIAPPADNADAAPVINYVLQEAQRIGGRAVVTASRGRYQLHTFVHCPDPDIQLVGFGRDESIFVFGQIDGTYMSTLSRTPVAGAAYSDAEIFSLLGLPSFFFYCRDLYNYVVELSSIGIEVPNVDDGRQGAKLYAPISDAEPEPAFFADNPEWDNAHCWSAISCQGFLTASTLIASVDADPEVVLPVGHGTLRIDKCRIAGDESSVITPMGYPHASMGQAVAFGSHALLMNDDPLLEGLAFFYHENGDGNLVAVLPQQGSPMCGECVIIDSIIQDGDAGPVLNFQDVIKRPVDMDNYVLWDFGNATADSKIVIERNTFIRCGRDTFAGGPAISTEGRTDADLRIRYNQMFDCGGLYNEFGFGTDYRLTEYDVGQPNNFLIEHNTCHDLYGTLPSEFAFAPMTIFGPSEGEGEDCIPLKQRKSFVIVNNSLTTTRAAGVPNMPFGMYIAGQPNGGRVEHNYIEASDTNVILDCCGEFIEQDN